MNNPLTERQQEILELYAEGLKQQMIARRLGVETSTVNDHYRAIRQRLDASSMAEAAQVARERGLL